MELKKKFKKIGFIFGLKREMKLVSYKNNNIVCVYGYGKASKNATRELIRLGVDIVFNFGFAGSISENLKNGDVVFINQIFNEKKERLSIFKFDRSLLRNLENTIPEELYRIGERKGRNRNQVFADVKNVLNYVEDRRIDYYVFKSSPGYTGYYHTMYDKYFHSKHIDKALQTDEYTDRDIDSYMFRLLNITNKNVDFTAVPQLKDIYNLIFTGDTNVKTIKSTDESLSIALEVIDIIYKNLEAPTLENKDGQEEPGKEGESGEGNDTDGTTTISDEKLQEMLENGQVQGGSGDDTNSQKVELTERQKQMLEKAFIKQKDFINGEPQKTGKLSKKDSKMVKTMEDAGVTMEDAGKDIPKLQAVDLYPPTTLLEGEQATPQLVAVARFSDGTDRDVTDLVWYGSNNDSSVGITSSGNAASGQRGESFVMARYDTITVGVPVVVIPKNLIFQYPESEGNTWVDDLVDTKLKSLRIAPSKVCSDETFLRRVSIDLVGLLPTQEERDAFLADKSPQKRSEYIEHLLGRKEFVDLWVMKWAEILQIRSINNIVDKKGALLYHQWLDRRIASNQPVDQMVRDLVTASGGTFENPPTNYYQAERNTLKLTENVAQAFLGMRIQCAQCHNHPFDRWTMDDYYGFAAFFAQIGRKRADDPRETIIYNSGGGGMKHPVSGQTVAPKYLGGGEAEVTNRDRREAVAEWLGSPENPFFAKRIANLVWTHFLGRGIVHEPDDFRVSNPPVNGPLLDALASHLVKSKWDFRELVREIVNSKTYQRACDTNDTNVLDNSNFSHSAVRRIRAEVLLDILAQVTETKNKFPGLPEGARAVQVADGRTSTYFLTTFGRATREEVCSCAVSMDPSLSQALHLLNGDVGNQRIQQGGVIDRWIKEGRPDTEIIDELFIRCYGRFPQERERVETLVAVHAGVGRKQALEDVFWALLNSPEFIFNH